MNMRIYSERFLLMVNHENSLVMRKQHRDCVPKLDQDGKNIAGIRMCMRQVISLKS